MGIDPVPGPGAALLIGIGHEFRGQDGEILFSDNKIGDLVMALKVRHPKGKVEGLVVVHNPALNCAGNDADLTLGPGVKKVDHGDLKGFAAKMVDCGGAGHLTSDKICQTHAQGFIIIFTRKKMTGQHQR